MMVRRLFLLGFSAALAAAYGCSSNSSDSGGGTTTPTIACTDGGPAAADGVTLRCGGTTSTTTANVTVVLGGTAAGTTTLRGLNFDITYDPAKVSFTAAGTYTSPLFPTALIAVQLANGTPGRVVVSIQQTGGSPDVTVPAGQSTVLTLSFARAAGATFTPTPLVLENTEATAPSAPIGFTSVLALSYS